MPVAGEWPGRSHGLTARESEVMALIAQGLTNQEIAERAYLSVNSVKTHIRSAYRKIGVERRSQAVLWATRNGFLPDHERTILGSGRSRAHPRGDPRGPWHGLGSLAILGFPSSSQHRHLATRTGRTASEE